jgi:hypothetical protein
LPFIRASPEKPRLAFFGCSEPEHRGFEITSSVKKCVFYSSDLPEELRAVLAATGVAPQAGRPARWQPPAARVGEAALCKIEAEGRINPPASTSFRMLGARAGHPGIGAIR